MRFDRIIAFSLVMGLMFSTLRADNFSGLANRGNRAFTGGDYKKALELYHQAELERPETPELQYNIGSALYKEGKYEEAEAKLQKSFVTSDIGNEAKAHYNLGNVYYRTGDYQKAIQSYQKSLELRPNDWDAKYNLELARKRLKEQIKPQQQKNQQQQEQNRQNQQQQPEKKDQKQPEQSPEQQQPQNQKQAQRQSQPANEKEISKEDAERILNAFKDDEKKIQKDVRQVKGPIEYRGKDW